MMTKRIIYEKDGQLNIVIPAKQFLDDGGTLQNIIDKNVPAGLTHQIIDTVNIPSDRTFRDAWKKSPDKIIDVDMPKARVIHMGRIRLVRDKELEKMDREIERDRDNGVNVTAKQNARQKLRDIPQTFDLELFKTPQALKNAWPTEIPR